MAEQATLAERITAFAPLFVASLVQSRGMREAHRQRTNEIKTKILQIITTDLRELLSGYEIVGSEWDDYCGEQVQEFFCENGWCGEMWQMRYSIRCNITEMLAGMLHKGFMIDGRKYYLDTYNDLVFRFLNQEQAKITIDDLNLISEEEHRSREKWSDMCHHVLKREHESTSRMYGSGILQVGSYRDKAVTPIDPGFTANVLKYFYVEQSKSMSGSAGMKYELPKTTAKIEALKGDSKTFPKMSCIIVWLLKENPVERTYRISTWGKNWQEATKTVTYYV